MPEHDHKGQASPHLEPIPLSALQHWCYCPRQCGLIHLEQAFEENVHTLRGQAVHRTVDVPGIELRAGLRVERALPVFHESLGLMGKCDVVEFQSDRVPYPVEYKHGSRNKAPAIADCDDVQLAGQALCLEAMFGMSVSEGALFYAKSKRRRVVTITTELRERTKEVARDVREMLASRRLPPPTADTRRCRECSLKDICQPDALATIASTQSLRADLFEPDA